MLGTPDVRFLPPVLTSSNNNSNNSTSTVVLCSLLAHHGLLPYLSCYPEQPPFPFVVRTWESLVYLSICMYVVCFITYLDY